MLQETVDGCGDHALAKAAPLVPAKQIDLVQPSGPRRIVLRRMTPYEADQLLRRRLQHENEIRRVGFRELRAPLPFPS